MSREITEDRAEASGRVVTRPGYLVEIGFESPVRLSNIGDVTWGGHAWLGSRALSVRGLSATGGTITVSNLDDTLGALVLNDGISDRPIKVWSADAEALGEDDPVLEFNGVGNSAQVTTREVQISLTLHRVASNWSPRRFIGPGIGLNTMIPSGTVIKIGNDKFTIER